MQRKIAYMRSFFVLFCDQSAKKQPFWQKMMFFAQFFQLFAGIFPFFAEVFSLFAEVGEN